MREKINTILLGVIVALLVILVLKPEPGRFQPAAVDSPNLVLDTKTGRVCAHVGASAFPRCQESE